MSDKPAESEAHVRFILNCRKIRLFIAKNPGCTRKQIAEACGARAEGPLFKMAHMGIVRFTQLEEDGRYPQRWYVVPQ